MNNSTLVFESNRSTLKLLRGLGSLASQRLGVRIGRQARRMKFLAEVNTRLVTPEAEEVKPAA